MTRTPPPEPVAMRRRLAAEFLGSGFLAAIVIGSGIAAQHLSPGSMGLELLENAATAATFAGIAPSSVPAFIAAQIFGGALAVLVIRALYPRLPPAQASDILFPHHASQAEAAQAHATPGGATAAAGPLPGHGPSY